MTTNKGSQLRVDPETGLTTRKWLSLVEYYQVFGEVVPKYSDDFRVSKDTCKWCGKPLTGTHTTFCSTECKKDYSWRVTKWRSLPAIPHRVALRDNFHCHYCGKDLASTNSHGVRLPIGSGEVSCDHLIPVTRGGTDYITNLVCACNSCNSAKGTLTVDEFYDKIEKKEEYQ